MQLLSLILIVEPKKPKKPNNLKNLKFRRSPILTTLALKKLFEVEPCQFIDKNTSNIQNNSSKKYQDSLKIYFMGFSLYCLGDLVTNVGVLVCIWDTPG